MSGPPPLPKRPRRDGIFVACILGLALTPILGLLGWHFSFRVSNARAVRRLEAKVRAKGEPLTLAELASRYPSIPDAENAAVPLLELWQKEEPRFWRAFRRGERTLPERSQPQVDPALPFLGASARRMPRAEPVPAARVAAAEAYLAQYSKHLEAVRLALRRPRCCFPVRITDGFSALLPHLPEMRREAERFRILGLLAVERGDAEAAISALDDVARTGQALAESPLLIDQLVRVSCLGMVLAALEARRRAAVVAIAVERYRLARDGHLPEKLEDLAPDFLPRTPADPFDGQPVRFHRLKIGYVIYSIGRDRQDNGGKERPQKGPATDYDETFIVER